MSQRILAGMFLVGRSGVASAEYARGRASSSSADEPWGSCLANSCLMLCYVIFCICVCVCYCFVHAWPVSGPVQALGRPFAGSDPISKQEQYVTVCLLYLHIVECTYNLRVYLFIQSRNNIRNGGWIGSRVSKHHLKSFQVSDNSLRDMLCDRRSTLI